MSKKVPKKAYEQTFSYRVKRWLDGAKDPYLDVVEMKPQMEFKESRVVSEEHKEEKSICASEFTIRSIMRSCAFSAKYITFSA